MNPARRGREAPAVVIVGHGGAAVHAVRGLREAGFRGVVQVLSDGEDAPYSPMLLAYYLAGAISRERCFVFGDGAGLHGELQVEFHGGDPVVMLDAYERTLGTRSGARYRYDTCIVASGASALTLPVPGADGERVHSLRTLRQADRLEEALASGAKRVLVVGSSLVGMKVVEALVLRGIEVVLADLAPQVLPAAAHPDCADLVARGLAARGVELHLGVGVTAFEESAGGLRAWLEPVGPGVAGPAAACPADPGACVVDVDLAVVAIGVSPNVDLVDRRQVEVDRGIVVDRQCRTSVSGLYAAGDCAQIWNPLTGRHETPGLWAAACYQGRTAGRNAARESTASGLAAFDAEPRPAPMATPMTPPDLAPPALAYNVIHFLDWVFVSIGDPRVGQGTAGALEACDPERDRYYRLVTQDGRVLGANLLNCCDGAGMLRHAAMRSRLRGDGASERLGWARFVRDQCGVAAAATAYADGAFKGGT